MQRINVGDLQAVRDERAGGAASARPYGDVSVFRELDEVPDDEEVAGEAHLLDHRDLARDALLVLRERVLELAVRLHAIPDRRAALLVALAYDLLEVLFNRDVALLARDGEDGQVVLAERELEIAHLCDLGRSAHGVGAEVFENLRHLFGRADVPLRAAEAHPVGVVDRAARADAEHHVVGLVVVAVEVVRVVGGDERDARSLREIDEVAVDPLLIFQLVILNL